MNKLLIQEQTKLVNKLIKLEEISYEEIENMEGQFDEVHIWYLINSCFLDVFDDLNIPYVKYEGQVWIGQTWWGCSWKNSHYWKPLCEKLPFLKDN